jgi:hypothetical protein
VAGQAAAVGARRRQLLAEPIELTGDDAIQERLLGLAAPVAGRKRPRGVAGAALLDERRRDDGGPGSGTDAEIHTG